MEINTKCIITKQTALMTNETEKQEMILGTSFLVRFISK